MSRFLKAVEAGVQGAMNATGPGRYKAGGAAVSCSHCGASEFAPREAQLNTAGMTLMDLDWMNRGGTALVCTNCGLIQWYAKEPERVID